MTRVDFYSSQHNLPEANIDMASMGAMIFVLARLVYLPLYMAAVPMLRSLVFTVGWGGMVAMGVALLAAA